MEYLIVAIICLFLVGMIHFYQLSRSYQEVIEEQNKIIKNRKL
jgi:hypothetical protein